MVFCFTGFVKKTMTFLEKMTSIKIINYIFFLGQKKYIFFAKNMFLEHDLKTWISRKLIPDALVNRKLIPKGTLILLYTNISQLITHTTVVYVAAYLAIMLPSLLAYCTG